jgi:hypothetical protein
MGNWHSGTSVPSCVSCFHKGSKIHGSVIAIRYGASLLFLIITTLFYTIQLFFCKENANERNESWLSNCRVQLFFCKDSKKKQIKQGCLKQCCLKPSFFAETAILRLIKT